MELNKYDHELIYNYTKKILPTYTNIKKMYKTSFHQLKEHGKDSFESVELAIHADCNQKCEYCYLYQHGLEIYPQEIRCDHNKILNNIKLLFDYFYEEEIFPISWSLFAGDLFYDDLYYKIIELFYDFYKKIKNNYPDYFTMLSNIEENFEDNRNYPISIMTPCNFSLCKFPKKMELLDEWINKMSSELNVELVFSYSTDGKYAIDSREKINITDEEFDNTFSFITKYLWGCHPMISAHNIKNWIQNYDWWLNIYSKYYSDTPDFQPAMLEVRNDEWDETSIQDYLNLLNHMIDKRLTLYNNDLLKFTLSIFFGDHDLFERYDMKKFPTQIDPLHIHIYKQGENNHMSCDIGFTYCINCYNLSIVPCHRLAHPHLAAGHFEIENNKIIGIKAEESINCYFNAILQNPQYRVGCNSCKYNLFCVKGCCGAQYEAFGDFNIPIPSVCKLFQAKFDFLFQKYHELGVFTILFEEIGNDIGYEIKQYILYFLLEKGYTEYGKYAKFN